MLDTCVYVSSIRTATLRISVSRIFRYFGFLITRCFTRFLLLPLLLCYLFLKAMYLLHFVSWHSSLSSLTAALSNFCSIFSEQHMNFSLTEGHNRLGEQMECGRMNPCHPLSIYTCLFVTSVHCSSEAPEDFTQVI